MAVHSTSDAHSQRAHDVATSAMRLATALAAGLVFPAFQASGMGDGPLALRFLLIVAGAYGAFALATWFLLAWTRVAAGTLRLPTLLADVVFACSVLIWGGEPGIVVYPLALLSVQCSRDRFGPAFARLAAFLMSIGFTTALGSVDLWSGHTISIGAISAGFWIVTFVSPRRTQAQTVERDLHTSEPAEMLSPDLTVSQPRMLPSRANSAVAARGDGASVLIADSNRVSRLLLTKILTHAGCRTTSVGDSSNAIAALGAPPDGKRFDAMILDLDLAGLGGKALAQLVRSTELGDTRINIIGLDGQDRRLAAPEWRSAGIDDCLPKPVDPMRLLDCLGALAPLPLIADETGSKPIEPAPASDAGEDRMVEALDMRALRDLEKLGGRDFVRDIAAQFVADGALALRSLAHSMQKGDAELFRDQAHALRSSAANVGARGIYVTCLAWREIEPDDLARNGATYLQGCSTLSTDGHCQY